MSMRYLVRRNNSEDLNEIKNRIKNIDTLLGKPALNLRRDIKVMHSPVQTALYTFYTKKINNDFVWTCPSIELSAESEDELYALLGKFSIPKPSHLI